MTDFSAQGGRGDDGHIKLDGMEAGGPVGGAGINQGGGGSTYYKPDVGNVQEVVVTTGAGRGGDGRPADQYRPALGRQHPERVVLPELRQRRYAGRQRDGRAESAECERGCQRGSGQYPRHHRRFRRPLKRDKVWFFVTARHLVTEKKVGLMFYNKNAGNPTAFLYEPDTSRPATPTPVCRAQAFV